MNSPSRFKKVLITGGSRGIGKSIAEKMLQEGHEVVITGTSNESLKVSGADFFPVNFEKEDELLSLCKYIESTSFDILINNAGINKTSPFAEIDDSDFLKIQQVNTIAPYKIIKSALPNMQKNKWGRIVNISSIFGKVSKELRAPYSASKFAIDGMTIALAAEVSQNNILVNCVAPGFIDTELTSRVLGPEGIKELSKRVPMKRLGQPEEVAELVSWLASSKNTYLTGQNIAIDGGFTRV